MTKKFFCRHEYEPYGQFSTRTRQQLKEGAEPCMCTQHNAHAQHWSYKKSAEMNHKWLGEGCCRKDEDKTLHFECEVWSNIGGIT